MKEYDEGEKVLLVGAASIARTGAEVTGGIRSCGGSALADGFAGPKITGQTNRSATIKLEGQSITVSAGDSIVIVKAPPAGSGLEVAVVRFSDQR